MVGVSYWRRRSEGRYWDGVGCEAFLSSEVSADSAGLVS